MDGMRERKKLVTGRIHKAKETRTHKLMKLLGGEVGHRSGTTTASQVDSSRQRPGVSQGRPATPSTVLPILRLQRKKHHSKAESETDRPTDQPTEPIRVC